MKLCTAVQEGCGYKDTLRAHRHFAPLTKYFIVCITYQPTYVACHFTRTSVWVTDYSGVTVQMADNKQEFVLTCIYICKEIPTISFSCLLNILVP